jgi:hypothetical protein
VRPWIQTPLPPKKESTNHFCSPVTTEKKELIFFTSSMGLFEHNSAFREPGKD